MSRTVGKRALVIVARRAEAGKVKTRLADGIGPAPALAVYVALLGDTMVHAQGVPSTDLFVAVAGDASDRQPGLGVLGLDGDDRLTPSAWTFIRQTDGNLGERLSGVFSQLFGGGFGSVAIVGSDSPGLPTEYISAGFDLLETTSAHGSGEEGHVVLGPAADGGYYFIGLGRSTWKTHERELRSLLGDTPMGSSRALPFTLRAATTLGLHVDQLPLWVDVDTVADLPLMERLMTPGSGETPRGEPLQSLREIYLHVTNHCTLHCPHCYNKSSPRGRGELTTAAWKDVIDQCAALGAENFVFIGGDPWLRRDLLELIEYVTTAKEAKARLFFNRPIDREAAEGLARVGHGRFRPLVSLDGPPATNDALRGEGNWDGVMSSVANLLAAGLSPVVNTVPLRPVLPGLPEMARLLREAGVTRLHLIVPHDRGGLVDTPELVASGAEMLQGLLALEAAAAGSSLFVDNIAAWRRRLKAPQDFCNAGCKDLAIDPFGKVYACTITCGDPAFVAGDLRTTGLEDIWRHSPAFRLLRNVHARDRVECRDCPVVDACGGECWMQAHYAARATETGGGYRAPFPYCDLVRPIMQRLAEEAAAQTEPRAQPDAVLTCSGDIASSCDPRHAEAAERNLTLFDCI